MSTGAPLADLIEIVQSKLEPDQLFEACFTCCEYPQTSLEKFKEELQPVDFARKLLLKALHGFIEFKTKALDKDKIEMHLQDMFTDFLMMVEIRGFADTIKVLGQSMEGIYLVQRLNLIQNFRLWHEQRSIQHLEGLERHQIRDQYEKIGPEITRAVNKLRSDCSVLASLAEDDRLKQTDLHSLFSSCADSLVDLLD